MRHFFFVVSAVVVLAASTSAVAGQCRIKNETKYSFKVESGNVSNQSVGAHTETSISSGKIIAKSSDGKGVGGSCRDGESIKIVEDKGVLMIVPR